MSYLIKRFLLGIGFYALLAAGVLHYEWVSPWSTLALLVAPMALFVYALGRE